MPGGADPGEGSDLRLAKLTAVAAIVLASVVQAAILGGGGAGSRDCIGVFEADANSPPPPRKARNIDCVDGAACDEDGTRNGRCACTVRVCVNSTALAACTPIDTDSVTVDHALDNGDPRFDTEFQALQSRVNVLGFPNNATPDDCTLPSAVTVRLRSPAQPGGPWQRNTKKLRVTSFGRASGRVGFDKDRLLLTCRPEGDGLYAPRDLYDGTFDRIAREIFVQRCAVSACHDSQGHQGNLILLPNAAYSQLVGVTPFNPFAADDGLVRVTPGDPASSFLYRKVTFDLLPAYGSGMPRTGPALAPAATELLRLWILGDGTTGPAPASGWVAGTD